MQNKKTILVIILLAVIALIVSYSLAHHNSPQYEQIDEVADLEQHNEVIEEVSDTGDPTDDTVDDTNGGGNGGGM